MMPPWLSHISSAQRKESKYDSSRWIQLATIGIDNVPRVRTVVFRGWSKLYEMEIYTDRRSQKFEELNINKNVEICWLLTKSKCQFRFQGMSRIDLGHDKLHHWQKLSEFSKSMWGWPSPGDVFVSDMNSNISVITDEDHFRNFILFKIEITQVDKLVLEKPIHKRIRWIKNDKEWIEERINP